MEETEEVTTEDEEETAEDQEVVEEQDNQGEVLEGDPLPPDLSIFIYEGTIYSTADDVCYYRIASELYGNPSFEAIIAVLTLRTVASQLSNNIMGIIFE